MRKMKKINGFLVVRFNDREKAGYPTLGNFGVIDAELYTGSIDVDLDTFEYDDADTIEVAVEQARGLDAEEDFSDEPPVYTVVTETSEELKEEEVEPQLLINGWERQLEAQVNSSRYKDVDPRTAAHELHGYKVALCDLGLLDQADRAVDPDHFAPDATEQPLPRSSEELLAHICDKVCRHPRADIPSDELEAICEECGVERLSNEAYDRETRIKEKAKKRLDGLIQELAETQIATKAEGLERGARAYLEAIATTKTLSEREAAIYEAAISEALKERAELPEPLCKSVDDDGHHVDVLLPTSKGLAVLSPHDYVEGETFTNCTVQILKCRRCGHESFAWSRGAAPKQETERETFVNLPANLVKEGDMRKVYALGLALAEKCPDNDCRVYLNIFNAAREIDTTLDELGEKAAVALPLRQALMERAGELWRMYHENYAIQRFKEEMKL